MPLQIIQKHEPVSVGVQFSPNVVYVFVGKPTVNLLYQQAELSAPEPLLLVLE